MAAGDVLLFHRKSTWQNFRADPKGTLMTALIHFTTDSKWNHAALAIDDKLMVEAQAHGVSVNPIRSTDEIRVIKMPRVLSSTAPCEPPQCFLRHYVGNDLEEVLAWAAGRVGWKYGVWNAFWCGLRHVLPGAAHIKHGKTVICSELVAEALERAGHDFGKDSALVSPGDLAEHFGVPRK